MCDANPVSTEKGGGRTLPHVPVVTSPDEGFYGIRKQCGRGLKIAILSA